MFAAGKYESLVPATTMSSGAGKSARQPTVPFLWCGQNRYHLDILEGMCPALVIIPVPIAPTLIFLPAVVVLSPRFEHCHDSSIVVPPTKSTDVPVGVFRYTPSDLYQFPQIGGSTGHTLRAEVFRGN